MKVDADEIQTKEADDRGRVYFGTDMARKKITFAILEVKDDTMNDNDSDATIECPDCGSNAFGIEDIGAGQNRIYCEECDFTHQVG